jgi:uncharacterized protein YxeA
MKRILIFVYTAFAIILLANFIYYKNLYNKQINYISALLDRQVQIVGLSVDETNNMFISDLNQIAFSEDLAMFFDENGSQAKDKLKLLLPGLNCTITKGMSIPLKRTKAESGLNSHLFFMFRGTYSTGISLLRITGSLIITSR